MANVNDAIKLAKNMNTLINFNSLAVPVLDKFILVKKNLTDQNNRIIFVAIKNNTLEQFLADGVLPKNESFEQHITGIYKEIKEQVKDNPLYEGNDDYFVYYKNYDNEHFDFKLYLQDILTGTPDRIKFVRQLSAYFIEPNGNEFYQIAMAAGQYVQSNKYKLLKDMKDYEKDEIIMGLEKDLKIIMDNITYRD